MKRLENKVAIITGGAQGFGEGIAYEMAKEGAQIVIADLNEQKAGETAKKLCDEFGEKAAVAIATDISSETSVENMVNKAVSIYGCIDILVANAGILRSGSLEEMSLQTFEMVTKVNYTGYFICAKYVSKAMKEIKAKHPEKTFDIIQINSKSGLEGSNKNFAYAGGKFGGIGLTQSFAKELVGYSIKVNSICPGNFFDGPLWTDPENGLFVQYLKAGKVPGAKTTADVKRFYEEKVPMNRGCSPLDVARAIFYCVEQQYETGQAIPVTGGQNMLK